MPQHVTNLISTTIDEITKTANVITAPITTAVVCQEEKEPKPTQTDQTAGPIESSQEPTKKDQEQDKANNGIKPASLQPNGNEQFCKACDLIKNIRLLPEFSADDLAVNTNASLQSTEAVKVPELPVASATQSSIASLIKPAALSPSMIANICKESALDNKVKESTKFNEQTIEVSSDSSISSADSPQTENLKDGQDKTVQKMSDTAVDPRRTVRVRFGMNGAEQGLGFSSPFGKTSMFGGHYEPQPSLLTNKLFNKPYNPSPNYGITPYNPAQNLLLRASKPTQSFGPNTAFNGTHQNPFMASGAAQGPQHNSFMPSTLAPRPQQNPFIASGAAQGRQQNPFMPATSGQGFGSNNIFGGSLSSPFGATNSQTNSPTSWWQQHNPWSNQIKSAQLPWSLVQQGSDPTSTSSRPMSVFTGAANKLFSLSNGIFDERQEDSPMAVEPQVNNVSPGVHQWNTPVATPVIGNNFTFGLSQTSVSLSTPASSADQSPGNVLENQPCFPVAPQPSKEKKPLLFRKPLLPMFRKKVKPQDSETKSTSELPQPTTTQPLSPGQISFAQPNQQSSTNVFPTFGQAHGIGASVTPNPPGNETSHVFGKQNQVFDSNAVASSFGTVYKPFGNVASSYASRSQNIGNVFAQPQEHYSDKANEMEMTNAQEHEPNAEESHQALIMTPTSNDDSHFTTEIHLDDAANDQQRELQKSSAISELVKLSQSMNTEAKALTEHVRHLPKDKKVQKSVLSELNKMCTAVQTEAKVLGQHVCQQSRVTEELETDEEHNSNPSELSKPGVAEQENHQTNSESLDANKGASHVSPNAADIYATTPSSDECADGHTGTTEGEDQGQEQSTPTSTVDDGAGDKSLPTVAAKVTKRHHRQRGNIKVTSTKLSLSFAVS